MICKLQIFMINCIYKGDKLATLLLIIIFIVFIGLGLPDSAFGASLPAIWGEFNLPISLSSVITMLISLGTVLASLFSARIINKLGTSITVAFSSLLTCLAVLGFALSKSALPLFLLAMPLGLGAGAIDAALNNYVALHYSPMQMSFLHCFYGVGVMITPYVFSLTLKDNNNWRLGYGVLTIALAVIALIAFLSIPLWKKISQTQPPSQKVTPKTLTYRQMAKSSAVRLAWATFFLTVALEFTCGTWGTSYLVHTEKVSEAFASSLLTLYNLGITLGRFLSGLISKKLSSKNIVLGGYGLVFVGIALLFTPLPPTLKGFSLMLIGLGNGPVFPHLTHLTPIFFGKDVSQSLVGAQMMWCNVGILTMPPLFGLLAGWLSTALFPLYLATLFILLVASTVAYFKAKKSQLFD